MKRGDSGQVSMEFFIVVAISFAIIVPLVLFYFQESQSAVEDVNEAQVTQIARKIVSNAETVHSFGEPTSLTLKVYLPKGINQVIFNNSEVVFRFYKTGQVFDVAELFSMNVTGSISNISGIHKIKIAAVNDSVEINDV